MTGDWEKAIAFVLKMEGGYTVDPGDPGGETNFGISKKAYPNVDIKNLSMDQAMEIYRRDYWAPCGCDELPAAFAVAVFDTAVNMGVVKAKRLLQIALDVDVDGVIGPGTLVAAVRAGNAEITMFLAQRLAEYARIIAANPVLLKFAVNWSHRVLSLAEIL